MIKRPAITPIAGLFLWRLYPVQTGCCFLMAITPSPPSPISMTTGTGGVIAICNPRPVCKRCFGRPPGARQAPRTIVAMPLQTRCIGSPAAPPHGAEKRRRAPKPLMNSGARRAARAAIFRYWGGGKITRKIPCRRPRSPIARLWCSPRGTPPPGKRIRNPFAASLSANRRCFRGAVRPPLHRRSRTCRCRPSRAAGRTSRWPAVRDRA